jgi:hypothetical protein
VLLLNSSPAVPLKQYLCHKFPSTKIFDDHQGYCHFQIMDKNVSLGLLFGAMENVKKKFYLFFFKFLTAIEIS